MSKSRSKAAGLGSLFARSADVVVPDMHSGIVPVVRQDIGPLNAEHKILTVGEGDLSFSVSLAMSFGGHRITATTFDSRPEVHLKYPHTGSNLRTLRAHGTVIYHSVDATKLGQYQDVMARGPYDRIVFMFPHVGGSTIDDIQDNQQVVGRFLLAAQPLLSKDGAVIIGLRDTEFYRRWKLPEIAQIMEFKHREEPFQVSQFIGYKPVRTNPAVRDAPTADNAQFHIMHPLPKPEDALAGKKRKHAEPDSEQSQQQQQQLQSPFKRAKGAAAGSPKPAPSKPAELVTKPKGGFRCLVCQTPVSNQTKLNGHLNSKKHAQKFRLELQKFKRSGKPLPAHLANPQVPLKPEDSVGLDEAEEDEEEEVLEEETTAAEDEDHSGQVRRQGRWPDPDSLADAVLRRFESGAIGAGSSKKGFQASQLSGKARVLQQKKEKTAKQQGKQARLQKQAAGSAAPEPQPDSLYQRNLHRLGREPPKFGGPGKPRASSTSSPGGRPASGQHNKGKPSFKGRR